MHPALHSWREELPHTFVRLLAYLGGLMVLSIAAARFFQSAPVMETMTPLYRSAWTEIERPFPAFGLSRPEAADAPAGYAILRHTNGVGRKDILTLGQEDSASPYLRVEIYRPGPEMEAFADATATIAGNAASIEPVNLKRDDEPLASKFGPLSVLSFDTGKDTPRHCLAFVREFGDPRLQMSGWFCQGETFVERSTLACALDRLTLLAAGSDPKTAALFARAELNRSFCGQRDPILAPTPKYQMLWRAHEQRQQRKSR